MQIVIHLILFFLAVILCLAQISMMAVFMGGESVDSVGLLELHQTLLIPLVCLSVYGLWRFYQQFEQDWLKMLWQRTPGWLVFAMALLNTMLFTGFWAFQIVTSRGVEAVIWQDLLPLVSSLISSVGFTIYFAFLARQQGPSYAERNAMRADPPPEWQDTWKK